MHGIHTFEMPLAGAEEHDVANATANTAAAMLRNNGVLVSMAGRAEKLPSDYDNGRIFILSNACSFPMGTGERVPEDPDDPGTHLTRLEWMQYTLRRYPLPQFMGNVQLCMTMHDVNRRHQANSSASVQLKISPARMQHIARELTVEQTEHVLQLVSGRLHGSRREAAFQDLDKAGRALYDAVCYASARLDGTPQYWRTLRNTSYAKWRWAGPPTMMITLNPSDFDSMVVFTAAGYPYTYSADGTPMGRPSALECWRIIQANPLAVAHFFKIFVAAFMDVFVGWPVDQPRQHSTTGLFGPVQYWFYKVEEQKRGMLHAHIMLSQPALQPAQLHRIAQDRELATAMIDFMESIVCQRLTNPLTPRKCILIHTGFPVAPWTQNYETPTACTRI
jgi:hypothetical protein